MRRWNLLKTVMRSFGDKNKLAQKLGVSTVTAARILKTLANLGYLREIQTTKPYSYDIFQNREKPKQFVLLEEINEYKTFYEKELKTFLTHTLSPYQNLHVRGISPATVDLPIKEPEPENTPLSSKERRCDKVPVEPIPNLFAQKKPELLFNSERTSENEIFKPTVKIEDSAILYPPSTACENVRNSQRNLEKASEPENKPEGQISRPMRSDFAFFKPEVEQPKLVEAPKGLLRCEFCAVQGKPMFFAAKHDLELHIKAFHSGHPDTKPDYVR
jgi:hypothetical protein